MNRSTDLSVVIPSLRGAPQALLDSINNQTILPAEIEVVVGISPNGRARNVGATRTTGNILLFIDDDAVLAHDRVIEGMLRFLDSPTVGVVGASRLVPIDAPRFQQRVARQVARINNPVVDQPLETNPDPPLYSTQVTTTCAAMRRDVFEQVGGFSEVLIRSVDPEMFHRVRRLGYSFILAPGVWAWHPAPSTLRKLVEKHFLYGLGHAQATRVHPELARGPERLPLLYFAFRTLVAPLQVFLSYSFGDPSLRFTLAPLKALASYASAVGYFYGRVTTKQQTDSKLGRVLGGS